MTVTAGQRRWRDSTMARLAAAGRSARRVHDNTLADIERIARRRERRLDEIAARANRERMPVPRPGVGPRAARVERLIGARAARRPAEATATRLQLTDAQVAEAAQAIAVALDGGHGAVAPTGSTRGVRPDGSRF